MNPNRWQDISRVYHAARALDGTRRSAYLQEACAGDASLRREVESLLAEDEAAAPLLADSVVERAAAEVAAEADEVGDLVGCTVGHYRVLERIGEGGMGVVYDAQDLRLPRVVALKFVQERFSRDRLALARFKREAGTLSLLNHPNICSIYEVDEYEGRPFFVMERLEGVTLRTRLQRGPLAAAELVDVAIQVAEALSAAHEQGVIHRDVKPGNIFLTRNGVKVLDFGLAKPVSRGQRDGVEDVTLPGSPVGTLRYMSPEQRQHDELDTRSDLFSLGVVLYEMATGVLPFEGRSGEETKTTGVATPPLRLTERVPHHPAQLGRIIQRLLAARPEDRYPSAAALVPELEALRRRISEGDWLVRALAWIRLRRRWLALLPVGALVAIVWAWMNIRTAEPRFTARDWILIASFENETDEAELGRTIRDSVTVEMHQSAHANVFPDDRLADVLGRMRIAPNTTVTEALAREICAREGLRAALLGSIGRLDNRFIVRARVIDSGTGGVLANAAEVVATLPETLVAARNVARALRRQLGESAGLVQAQSVPLAPVTSASFEAVQLFTLARDDLRNRKPREALALLERALTLDRSFAMAHHYAALACANLGDFTGLIAHEQEAIKLADRLGPRERYAIQADYFQLIDRYDEAASNYRLLISNYPDDDRSYANLGIIHGKNLQFAPAIEAMTRAAELRPNPSAGLEMADLYFQSAQADAAARLVSEYRGSTGDDFGALIKLATFELARGRLTDAERLLAEAAQPASTNRASAHRLAVAWSDALLAQGRYREALDRLDGAPIVFEVEPDRTVAWVRAYRLAEVLALSGNRPRAREILRQLPDQPWNQPLWLLKGLLAASVDDLATAESVLDQLTHMIDRYGFGPPARARVQMLEAEITIAQRRPERAADLALQALRSFPSALMLETLARAQAAVGDLAAAAESYQRVLSRIGERTLDYDAPAFFRIVLARYELAKLLERLDRRNEANENYEVFLRFWERADETVPALRDARRRLGEGRKRAGTGAQSTPAGRVPTPARYNTDSLTPSMPRSFSMRESASASVQNGASPSHVATRQNVWHRWPASISTAR